MTLENITKILDSIQPEIQKIEGANTKRVVAVLLNLIEMLASDNARLKHENQLLGLWTNLHRKIPIIALCLDFTEFMIILFAQYNISSGITNLEGGYQKYIY